MTKECLDARDKYWLIKDETLSGMQLDNFNKHIQGCLECQRFIKDTDGLISEYSSMPLYDLDEYSYTQMMNKVLLKKSVLSFWPLSRKTDVSIKSNFPRYAFVSLIVIATIALLVYFNLEKPEIKKPVISFDWKAEKIENNIQKIDSSLVIIKTRTVTKTLFQKDPWKSSAYLLARDIERMQTELNKSSL